MTRLVFFLTTAFVALVLAIGLARAEDGGMIAGAGTGDFPGGATLAGIALHGLDFGQGVLTSPDGSALGAFHAVLRGPAQVVSVDGTVTAGAVAGVATFSGTATVSLGDGGAPLTAVPFQVALGPDGLQLAIDGTVLPTVTVSPGAIAIE